LVLEPDPAKKLGHTSSSLWRLWLTMMTGGGQLVKYMVLCILWITRTFFLGLLAI
jgi:hypothetical protein